MKQLVTMLLAICFGISLLAQTNAVTTFPKTIEVTGSAEMEIIPDEIYVVVELREIKKKGSITPLETIKTDFLNKCKKVGLADSDVTIASYEGSNYNYWYWRRSKKNPDLLSGISYQILFRDSKKMDDLIDLLDDEATAGFSIVKTSHSKIQEYKKQLKIQAIKAAKEKSVYLTEAINEKAGEALSISESGNPFSVISPYLNNNLSMMANSRARYQANETFADGVKNNLTPVDFKKIKLSYEVNVVFALK